MTSCSLEHSALLPGIITIGDILEILPFEDPIVVLEIDGATLWDALESSLKTWPAQEGSVVFFEPSHYLICRGIGDFQQYRVSVYPGIPGGNPEIVYWVSGY